MAQTLQTICQFDEVATYASGTIGTVLSSALSGSAYRRARGPFKSPVASPGYSAEIRQAQAKFVQPVSSGAQTLGQHSIWYYIKSVTSDGTNGVFLSYICTDTGGATGQTWPLLKNGTTRIIQIGYAGITAGTDTTQAVPLNTWFCLTCAWTKVTTNITFKWLYHEIGGTATQISTNTVAVAAAVVQSVMVGAQRGGGSDASNNINGRIGASTVYTLGVIGDAGNPSGVTEPSNAGTTIYFNEATGSASNDGFTTGTASATIAEFNLRTRYTGFIAGDTVSIDGSTTPMDFGAVIMELNTNNLTVDWNGVAPTLHHDISSGSWSLTSGKTRVYETTDGSATDMAGAVLWEDLKWLNKLNLNDYADEATLLTALDAVGKAGYFYCNGTKMYVNTTDSSSPGSNGRAYSRSRNRIGPLGSFAAADSGGSAIGVVGCSGTLIKNCPADYARTTLAAKADADPYNGYLIQWDLSCTGSHEARNIHAGYWSKHGLGRTTDGSNITVTRTRVTYGPGTPYVGTGGQTADVDFSNGGSGNQGIYVSPICLANKGNIGSVGGAVETGYPFWIDHGTTSNMLSLIQMSNGVLCSGLIEQSAMSGGIIRLINMRNVAVTLGNATIVRIDDIPRAVAASSGAPLGFGFGF